MEAHKESEINVIRGKWLGKAVTQDDIEVLLDHITALENLLDEGDMEDMYGTGGWRHHLGIDD